MEKLCLCQCHLVTTFCPYFLLCSVTISGVPSSPHEYILTTQWYWSTLTVFLAFLDRSQYIKPLQAFAFSSVMPMGLAWTGPWGLDQRVVPISLVHRKMVPFFFYRNGIILCERKLEIRQWTYFEVGDDVDTSVKAIWLGVETVEWCVFFLE